MAQLIIIVVFSALLLGAVMEHLPLLTVLVANPTTVEAHVHTILALLGYRDQQQQQHRI